MRGAVAAGHEITAQAGARALEEGGNAVDACIAAAFASWVAESPLTGPGAGGFMLVHRAQDRSSRLLDFFVAAPGLGRPRRADGEMDAVDIPFEGSETTQRFLIGHASCAVPGAVAGLAAATGRTARCRGRAGGARDRARTRGRRDDEGAGAAPRAARLDPAAHAGEQGRVRRAREARGGRSARPGSRRHARGACGRGTGCALPRRARRGDRGARAGARRRDHAARSRDVPRDPPPARGSRVPRPRLRVEPAAVVGRRVDRLRARVARPGRAVRRRRLGRRAGARPRGAA